MQFRGVQFKFNRAAWFNKSGNHLFLNLERNDADAALDACQHVLGVEWPNDDAAAEPMIGRAMGVGGNSTNALPFSLGIRRETLARQRCSGRASGAFF